MAKRLLVRAPRIAYKSYALAKHGLGVLCSYDDAFIGRLFKKRPY